MRCSNSDGGRGGGRASRSIAVIARADGRGSMTEMIITGRIATIANAGAGLVAVAVAAASASSIEQQQLALIVGDDGGGLCSFVIFGGQQHDVRAMLSCEQRYIANA